MTAQDAALGAHLANPVVGTYLEKHAELGEDFKVVRVLPWLRPSTRVLVALSDL